MGIQLKTKNKLIAIIALALVLIIALSIIIVNVLSPKKTPVAAEYITITIDNSVSASFTLSNDDYTVTAASTYKAADNYLVDNISSSVSFSQAIDTFIKELVAAKKLSGDNDEVLLFSVESRSEKDFELLTNYFRDGLKEAGCSTRIYTLYIKVKTDSVQKLADKHSVSYAKAHLCVKLEKENSKLKAEELIDLSVTEIVERVNKVAADDLLSKVESDTNEEQKNEELPEEKPESSDPTSSGDASSDGTSSDAASSDTTSSDTTSSDTTSSGTTSSTTSSGTNVSFVVSNDDKGWLPGLH